MPVGEFLAGRAGTFPRAAALRRRRCARGCSRCSGLIHQTRGQYADARRALDGALAEQQRLLGADHPDTLESFQALAELAAALGEEKRARALLEESLRRHTRGLRRSTRADGARSSRPRAPRGHDRSRRERPPAEPRGRDFPGKAAGRRPRRADVLGSLGGYYTRRAEYDRAKEAYQQALAVFPTPQALRHPSAITHPERLRESVSTRSTSMSKPRRCSAKPSRWAGRSLALTR